MHKHTLTQFALESKKKNKKLKGNKNNEICDSFNRWAAHRLQFRCFDTDKISHHDVRNTYLHANFQWIRNILWILFIMIVIA